MEQEIVRIQCPTCRAELKVRQSDIIRASATKATVTCPTCHTKQLLADYLLIEEQVADETVLASSSAQSATPQGAGAVGTLVAGRLRLLPFGAVYQLQLGLNVIGRRSSKDPHADIEIDTDSKLLSRQHVVVSVQQVPGKGTMHSVSLCKERVNATYVDNVRLEFGDTIILKNGDILKLPDAELLFEA